MAMRGPEPMEARMPVEDFTRTPTRLLSFRIR